MPMPWHQRFPVPLFTFAALPDPGKETCSCKNLCQAKILHKPLAKFQKQPENGYKKGRRLFRPRPEVLHCIAVSNPSDHGTF